VINGPGVLLLDARNARRVDHKARQLRSQALQKILYVRLRIGLPSTLMYLNIIIFFTLSVGNVVDSTVAHHQSNESTPIQIARFVLYKFSGEPRAIRPQVHGIAIESDSRDFMIFMSDCTGLAIPLTVTFARRTFECI
jgi:hypothetical protein